MPDAESLSHSKWECKYHGVVLSSSSSDRMKAELVEAAIQRALKNWPIPSGTIFHSDRGSQYTSGKVMSLLEASGLRQSFSRVGKPGDNAIFTMFESRQR